MKKQTLEQKFEAAFEGIRKYAKGELYSSVTRTNFKAYHDLVSLGQEALPLLRKKIGNDDECRWYVVLASNEILKRYKEDFGFPKAISGYLPQMEDYLASYLDKNYGNANE
jgi:hypothetical protein